MMVSGMFPVKYEVKLSLYSGRAGLSIKFKIPGIIGSHKYMYFISNAVFNLYWHPEAFIAFHKRSK